MGFQKKMNKMRWSFGFEKDEQNKGWSFKEDEQNNYILVDLMKAFIISQQKPFILQLVQEILDF
jgi:hypothetical protein